MMFVGHVQRVRCIDWFENDLGFTTCCLGGNIYFYDLNQHQKNMKAIGARNTEKDYNKKEVKFTSVVNVPGKSYEVLAVGSDKMITSNAPLKKGQKEMMPDDLPAVISQIVITPSGKSVIAGVGEMDKPGAIQIWSKPEDKPLDKINEVQAHSKAVERLRLSDDC